MVQPRHLKDVSYRQVEQSKVYLSLGRIEFLDSLVASYFKDRDNRKYQNPSDRHSRVGNDALRKHLGRNVLLQGDTGTGKSFVVGKVSRS